MIITRSPLRISLGGGGTDLYSWYKKYGSFFLTAAIDKYIYVTLNERSLKKDFWISYSKIEKVSKKKNIEHSIIKKILNNKNFKNGLELHTISEVPSGSGLGSSGALAVGLIKTISEYQKKKISTKKLADQSVDIEMQLNKKNAGKQDQYISAYGGLKEVTINKNGVTSVKDMKISQKNINILKKNLIIVYSNENRNANTVIAKQSQELKKNRDKQMLMKKIQDIAYETKDLLKSKNISDFGKLLNEHWIVKKKFGEYMSNSILDKQYEQYLENGASGGKIIGAGGGGFFMLYVENHKKLDNYLKKKNHKKLLWNFDNIGTKVILNSFNRK